MTDDTTVRAMLAANGLLLAEEEIAGCSALYPMVRLMVETMYGVAASRYEVIAEVFDPEPHFEDWM